MRDSDEHAAYEHELCTMANLIIETAEEWSEYDRAIWNGGNNPARRGLGDTELIDHTDLRASPHSEKHYVDRSQ